MEQADRDRVSAAIERDIELLRRGHQLPRRDASASRLPLWWFVVMALQVGALALVLFVR